MALQETRIQDYHQILREELLVAMGCTEPIAIAYAASILRRTLGERPERILGRFSGNIIKNAKSVVVPATGGCHGIEAAIAAGIIAAAPEKKLEVLTVLTPSQEPEIVQFRRDCRFELSELTSIHAFDLCLEGFAGAHQAQVRIQKNHTNVVSVLRDGENITVEYLVEQAREEDVRTDRSVLNVEDIVTYCREADLSPVTELIQRQITMNMAIAQEGLRGDYGASIGKVLYREGQASLKDQARAWAAAGSDARMSGCEMPVAILSGSGNQGMTASIPVVVYGRALGVSEEMLIRAVALSDLITIHQKTGIGCLSAYCGAISAGCGAGCGICFLYGGDFSQIAHTLVNAVAILSGTICDGAKPSCAAKIAMAVEAGILGYEMMKADKEFHGGDGIVTKGVENTIRNVGLLAREGMLETDREIIRIMLG